MSSVLICWVALASLPALLGCPFPLLVGNRRLQGWQTFMAASLWSGQATGQVEDSILCQELIGQLVLQSLKRKGGEDPYMALWPLRMSICTPHSHKRVCTCTHTQHLCT